MKTLGLSMIVGSNESFELERCLKSIQGPLFDEITLVLTQPDLDTEKIAQKFANVKRFTWIDDFSAARNFALDQMSTDYVMWIDTDDIITKTNYNKILELKTIVDTQDIWFFQYNYVHDQYDRPTDILIRERIFERGPKFRWSDPVHECIDYTLIDCKKEIRRDICIDHYRIKPSDPNRNIRILKKAYESNPTPRISFYYGRDLMHVDPDAGHLILKNFVKKSEGSPDDLAQACQRLATYYLKNNLYEDAKRYATLGLSYSTSYAELYCDIAAVCELQGNFDGALKFYQDALTKDINGLLSQLPDYYRAIPAARISAIYARRKNYTEAFKYNRLALQYKPTQSELLQDQKTLINILKPGFKVSWLNTEEDLHPIHEHFLSLGIKSSWDSSYDPTADIVVIFKYQPISFKYPLQKIIMSVGDQKIDPIFCFSTDINAFVCTTSELLGYYKQNGFKNVYVIRNPGSPYTSDNLYFSSESYSAVATANEWFYLLQDALISQDGVDGASLTIRVRPPVDVIVTSFNNVDCLKLCINSLYNSISYPLRVIISDAGSGKEVWDYLESLKGITILGARDKRISFSEVCSQALKVSTSRFFVLLDGDKIVSKNWLENLVNQMETKHRLAACEALTDWSYGALKNDPKIRFIQMGIYADMIQQRPPNIQYLQEFMGGINDQYKDQFEPLNWISLHSTIFSRSAIEEVGFDVKDLGLKFRKMNYKIGQSAGALLFSLNFNQPGVLSNVWV